MRRCLAHHLREWEHGGPTTLNNLALLCGRHHTIVHRDHLTATVHDRHDGPPGPHVTWHPPDPGVGA